MKKIFNKYIPLVYGFYFNWYVIFSKKKTAEKAFRLFCTVRKGKVLEKQVDFLNKAKLNLEPINNLNIQSYNWEGEKETILLIHGWESNTFRWRNLITKLKKANYNIIAFDGPAHGYSSGKELNVPLYSDCIQYFIEKHKPKYLVAHSVGGMTAMFNQSKHSNSSIEKMVIIGAPSEFYEIFEHYQNILKFNDKVYKAIDAYILERFGFRIKEFSTSKFALTNTKKGLLLHDELDNLAPFHASVKVHANWKESKFIQTKGLGHSMHQEHINDHILDFIISK